MAARESFGLGAMKEPRNRSGFLFGEASRPKGCIRALVEDFRSHPLSPKMRVTFLECGNTWHTVYGGSTAICGRG